MLKFRKPFILEWWSTFGRTHWMRWQLVVIDVLEKPAEREYVFRPRLRQIMRTV